MTENHLLPISIFLYENQPSQGFPPLAREETALQALADYGHLVLQPFKVDVENPSGERMQNDREQLQQRVTKNTVDCSMLHRQSG